jgi:NAD(P)-dependent dehydrogenase (short-subunit alcohol dehydrogenase family)
MNRLDGKIALISGAARGIGAETARLMAKAGAKVAVGDVLDERGRETVQAIESAGAEAIYTRLDVTREADWTAAVAAVTDRFGGLDILVNNAGVFSRDGPRRGDPRRLASALRREFDRRLPRHEVVGAGAA